MIFHSIPEGEEGGQPARRRAGVLLLPSFADPRRRGKGTLTRIHPLHAKWKGIVGDQIISSPPGIREDRVRIHNHRTYCCEKPAPRGEHGAYIYIYVYMCVCVCVCV